ncbi:MAG: molecular chaperone DnaJ [Pseudomonas sp.]|nr:molecular chaperone DnaJ [Pseudomonas sp.]
MANTSPQLTLVQQPDDAPLTPGQKKFNNLLKKIDTQRQVLESWQAALPAYQKLWIAEFKPLLDQFDTLDMEQLRILDAASDHIKFGKKDRETLLDNIFRLITSMMGGPEDAAVKELFAKHTGRDFDTVRQEENARFRASLEEDFGVDLGDDVDLDVLDEVTQRLHEKLSEQAEQQKPRQKSARDIRQEEEQAKISQSVRDIYRKLASALHPDRETDNAERDRKTVLMQRANEAYANSDLLGLLHLQLEAEQIDQQHISNLSKERLKHFNHVLTEQLRDLEYEIHDVKMALSLQLLLDPHEDIKLTTLPRKVEKRLHWLHKEVEDMKEQLSFISDTKQLKWWLKRQRYPYHG